MSSLRKVCVDTKVHVYRALVQSVLLYGSEMWTLLDSDIKKLEAFHLRCQRELLCVSWRDHITIEAICKQTKLASVTELISRRRMSLFGHIAWLGADVPAHQSLWLQTNISTGRNPGTSWKRLPGRPRKTWTSQIPDDTGMSSRGCLHSSLPWKRDATFSEDYVLMMMSQLACACSITMTSQLLVLHCSLSVSICIIGYFSVQNANGINKQW